MKKTTLLTLIIFTGFLSMQSLLAAEVKKPLPLLPAKSAPVQPQAVPAPQPPLPAVPAESTYSYNPVGKPDPFQPFVDEEISAKKKEGKKNAVSIYPLQRMEADQFRLVGITGNKNRRIAMVEDAAKKYYPLSVGTHIGVNNGKVIEILPDRVVIEEYVTKKANRIILKLHKN